MENIDIDAAYLSQSIQALEEDTRPGWSSSGTLQALKVHNTDHRTLKVAATGPARYCPVLQVKPSFLASLAAISRGRLVRLGRHTNPVFLFKQILPQVRKCTWGARDSSCGSLGWPQRGWEALKL